MHEVQHLKLKSDQNKKYNEKEIGKWGGRGPAYSNLDWIWITENHSSHLWNIRLTALEINWNIKKNNKYSMHIIIIMKLLLLLLLL